MIKKKLKTLNILNRYYLRFFSFFLIILLSSFYFPVYSQTLSSNIQGSWLTIDEQTNQPRCIISLNIQNKQLTGKISRIHYKPGEKPTDICQACKDDAHRNKPILGMILLWGLTQTGPDHWQNGFVIDPQNGKIYHCDITLAPNGQSLTVRGYLGFSLFGRTQVWMRIDP